MSRNRVQSIVTFATPPVRESRASPRCGLVGAGTVTQHSLVLTQHGFELWGRIIDDRLVDVERAELFQSDEPGTRCLLDHPSVREIVAITRAKLIDAERLPRGAVAIQAIAFDKTPGTNWKVTWHQDVMFPFARAVQCDGFTLPSNKEGVDYARPPTAVLEALLAVRIHLDDCDGTNGPLRVSSGTHRRGVIRSSEIAAVVAQYGETMCAAKLAEALLMKPLLLHASSSAVVPKHRRVLHLVFHSGEPIAEPWHRAI